MLRNDVPYILSYVWAGRHEILELTLRCQSSFISLLVHVSHFLEFPLQVHDLGLFLTSLSFHIITFRSKSESSVEIYQGLNCTQISTSNVGSLSLKFRSPQLNLFAHNLQYLVSGLSLGIFQGKSWTVYEQFASNENLTSPFFIWYFHVHVYSKNVKNMFFKT